MPDNPVHDIFNLIEAPWLPVKRRSGAVVSIAPWQITERMADDPFVAFAWPRPDFNGAAHEFLIGLLTTSAAPEDDDHWENWWHDPPSPERMQEQFSRFADAFNLDGPGPRFLQDLDPLESVEDKKVAALLIDSPGAKTLQDNTDLFVKRGGAPVLCRAAAAIALYTLSAYAPSGGAGHRTSLRGGGPMTTLVVVTHEDYGDTLWGRLWPNVESREQIETRAPETMLHDKPESIFPWLAPTRTSEPKTGRSTTPTDVHPLQVYWGMPRRIRLSFESSEGRPCSLMGTPDGSIVKSYRTKNYGTKYSEGFEHPLTPYYRQETGAAKLAVHPSPGGISYRHWPGLIVPRTDDMGEPARVVRHIHERAELGEEELGEEIRCLALGYDMDNMKARAWIESEIPIWQVREATVRDQLKDFVLRATAGATTVARLLIGAVKTALNPGASGATGDYGFIGERFYRDTEPQFYAALREARTLMQSDGEDDDPCAGVLTGWAPTMAKVALRLFDEYSPFDGLENRDMHRHVKARFLLSLALRGYGKAGRSLFGRDLKIVPPEAARARKRKEKFS